MASPLENALLSDDYQDAIQNPLTEPKSSWRDELEPDYESEPPPVTLGDDGNYYANDNRWNYGEWITNVGTTPVYWVEGGTERSKVDDDQFEIDEFGNVITKDADLVANGKALNPSGQWMTEEQIRNRWDSNEGMNVFKKANPNMSVDDYMSFVKESTALQAQGIKRLGEGGLSAEYQALYDKYGVATEYTDSSGNRYDFNGGTYTKTVDGVDMGSQILHGAVLGILGAGISAGLAPVLTSALGPAGAKAASSAITSLAKQYMMTGDISFEDAMLSAALSYGGSQLSDLIEGSGVLSDLSSQFDSVAGDLVSNGGDILKSALTAGGMSLVTQMVKDGEIDWKDAAIAAAMAGGTTALQGFLADIGKPDAEGEVLQEISVTAQRKGTQVGEGLWQLDDGTVISDSGNVLGNMTNLDLDGDGILNNNDLQEINVDHDFVDPNYSPPFVDHLSGQEGFVEGRTYYVSEDGVIHQRDDVKYIDGGPDGTYLVRDSQGNEFYVRDATFNAEGRFVDENGNYVAVNGYYDAKTNEVYNNIEDYTSPNAINDNTGNQVELTYGRDPNWNNDPNYRGTVYGGGGAYGVNGEMDIFYDPTTNTYYTSDTMGNQTVVNVEELPENIRDQVESASGDANNDNATGDPNDSSDAGMGNGGGNAESTGGEEGADGAAGGSDGGSTGGGSTGGGIDTGDIGSGGNQDATGNETSKPTDPDSTGNPTGGNTGGNTDNTGGNTTNDSGNGTNTGSGTESGTGGVTGSETGTGSGSGSGDGSASGTESGSGNTGAGSGTGSSGDGAGSDGTSGSGAGSDSGTGGGVGGGAGSDTGGGEGDVDGSGSGTEAGSGDGAGGGGAGGGGLGSGQGMLSGNNTSDRPVWGPLFAGTQFRPRDKARAQLKGRLFDDLFKDYI
jgi:hypothetical protein